jgi:BirA family biotin operon repressor/biotin-[acetyl-CoA-carboxylase] ligase
LQQNSVIFDTIYYETLPSSNSEAIRLASAGAPEGTVVVCRKQTAGRGQRNNSWESAPDKNLTMSLILRPVDMATDKLFLLSKMFSLAVVKSLNQYNIDALIKWPNDIYARKRKIAGILIEHTFSGSNLLFSVIGLGLNVNQNEFVSMNILPTSVALETGKNYDINEILSSVLTNFSSLYESPKETVINGYMEKLYQRAGYFSYMTKNGRLIAEIQDVADSGELILRDKNGKLSAFRFKEIQYLSDD